MTTYSINKNSQSNGDHEIHKSGCSFEPSSTNRIELGYHLNDYVALQAGKKIYSAADGCAFCCPAIHARQDGASVKFRYYFGKVEFE